MRVPPAKRDKQADRGRQADRDEQDDRQLRRERRSQLRGLLYLAGAVILFAMLRFGWHRVFMPYWWLP